jgi:hypothetical protein
MTFLLSIHPALSFAIVSVSSATLAILGLIMVRKKIHVERLKEHHDVSGIIFNAFGLLYAVLIAFVVYATWSAYDTTKKNIEMEANKLSDLFMDAGAFADPMKTKILVAVSEYTKTVVEEDWPTLASGGNPPKKVRDAYQNIWDAYLNVDVKAINNVYMYQESLHQLNTMSEYRRLRRLASKSSTPFVIWLVLIAGGIMSVAYTFFFGTKKLKPQSIMTASYAIMNSMVLFLIYILDHPFTGYSAISNEPFQAILKGFLHRLGQ